MVFVLFAGTQVFQLATSHGQMELSSGLPGSSKIEEDEPLYVNAKQYHRILKRRQARAKLEAQGLISKERQVYALVNDKPFYLF